MRTMIPIVLTGLAACLTTTAALAQAVCPVMPEQTEEIADPALYIEYHAADEDLGVHGGFGADGWKSACLYDPTGAPVLHVTPNAALADLTMADIFFESREPPLDEYGFSDLKSGFTEGDYRFEALSHDGKGLVGTTGFSTVVPSMPVITSPGFVEDEDGAMDPIAGDIVIRWDPVTTSVDGRPVTIVGYQFTVVPAGEDHPQGWKLPELMIDVPPSVTSYTVPEGFLAPATLHEVEVLAVADDHNQTIGLKWFTTP